MLIIKLSIFHSNLINYRLILMKFVCRRIMIFLSLVMLICSIDKLLIDLLINSLSLALCQQAHYEHWSTVARNDMANNRLIHCETIRPLPCNEILLKVASQLANEILSGNVVHIDRHGSQRVKI